MYGYGLLGQTEDAQRALRRLRQQATTRYVDSPRWAWAYLGIGDYQEALNQLNAAADNPERIQYLLALNYIRVNFWRDPMLEEPEFVEVRNRLPFAQ